MKRINPIIVGIITLLIMLSSCTKSVKEVNIGFIAPLSTRATDLGIGPAKAMELAVHQYNESRPRNSPKVKLYVEDDKWEGANAVQAYENLKKKAAIDLLFISNSDGTIALQDLIVKDDLVLINPLNNDSSLTTQTSNSFFIAKTTEEANGVIGARIIELGLRNVLFLEFPNRFMTRATETATSLLAKAKVPYTKITCDVGQTDYSEIVALADTIDFDAVVFFGYKDFGFAMKQLRDAGEDAKYFGSTVLLDPAFYLTSDGTIIGTECTFFTPEDGNALLAEEFLMNYETFHKEVPSSVWPPMQAYDAMNMALSIVKEVNNEKGKEGFSTWFKTRMLSMKFYPGVCGNLSVLDDGSSRGIYFNLYKYVDQNKLEKVN